MYGAVCIWLCVWHKYFFNTFQFSLFAGVERGKQILIEINEMTEHCLNVITKHSKQ